MGNEGGGKRNYPRWIQTHKRTEHHVQPRIAWLPDIPRYVQWKSIKWGHFQPVPQHVSSTLKMLIYGCWWENQEQRLYWP